MDFGYIVVYRKGKASAPYELEAGEHTIGSSANSNIRLKFPHPLLMETHAIIRVNDGGVASIINKSVGAPVKVNGKMVLKPTILKHEDQFEILDKTFQYFNVNLTNEPESSNKFVKEQKNILAKGRQSVNPLIKTPAKKSPNLKTKTPVIRKSTSAVKPALRPSKGVQVIITPNKKPENRVGSQTTSKIIVSKALVSPRTTTKRRLSLDTLKSKVCESPKVSSRNILLSKSTINITISEEHEYSEVTPSQSMRTIQEDASPEENLIKTKGRTPRRSVKVEREDSTNNDISVALIDFDTPGVESSSIKGRRSSLRNTPQRCQSAVKSDDFIEEVVPSKGNIPSIANILKTPVNKRIKHLKIVRHSLKKDTPRPRLSGNESRRTKSLSLLNEDIIKKDVLDSPGRSRRSTKLNISRKYSADTKEAPSERLSILKSSSRLSKNISLHNTNLDESNDIAKSKNTSVLEEQNGVEPKTIDKSLGLSRRSVKFEESVVSLHADNSTADIEDNGNKSSRLSRNLSRRSSNFSHTKDNIADKDNLNKSARLSRNTFRSLKLNPSVSSTDDEAMDAEDNVNKSANLSKNAPKRSTKLDSISSLSDTEEVEQNLNRSARVSGNISRRSSKFEQSATSSKIEMPATNAEVNTSLKNPSRKSIKVNQSDSLNLSETEGNIAVQEYSILSRNQSKRSTNLETSTPSLLLVDNELETEKNVSKSRLSRRSTRSDQAASFPETDDGATDADNSINKSSRIFSNTSRRSTKLERLGSYSQTEDNETDTETNVSKSSKSPRKSSLMSKLALSASSSQPEDNETDAETNVSQPSKSSRKSSLMSKLALSASSSQSNENTDYAENSINKSLKLSRNTSRQSTKLERSTSFSQPEDNETDAETNVSQPSKLSRKSSLISKLALSASSSHSEENTDDAEKSISSTSRLSRNTSRRSTKLKRSASSSQTDDNETDAEIGVNKSSKLPRKSSLMSMLALSDSLPSEDNIGDTEKNINNSSRLSRNTSRRSTKLERSANYSQIKDTEADTENISKLRLSRNTSRRTINLDQSASLSGIEGRVTDEENIVNNTSKPIVNIPRHSTKFERSAGFPQTEDNAKDAEINVNNSSRMSRNASGKNIKSELSSLSSQSDNNDISTGKINKSFKSFKNASQRNIKLDQSLDASLPDKSSRLSRSTYTRRSTLPMQSPQKSLRNQSTLATSQSTIDSTESTLNANTTKNKQNLSIFDESTQEAKPQNASKYRSQQKVSFLDESTKENLQVDNSKSMQPISILDDTEEVLSPVRPLSSRKSIRSAQGQDLERSQDVSTRIPSVRTSRSKNRTLQDSSLTATSMNQSSSSVISISSQSFSSFKRGSFREEESQNETEIDVVNISSTIDTPERKSFVASSVKVEGLSERNASRSSKRRSSAIQMFKDVNCTSTPFHRPNISKKSEELESAVEIDNKRNTAASSVVSRRSVKKSDTPNGSNDSVFANSMEENSKNASNVFEISGVSRRRSSSRSSVSRNGGEHNCISCRSDISEKKNASTSLRPSKSLRKSSGNVLEDTYENTSPIKRTSGPSTRKITSPLLHRKVLATSLSEKTPEKSTETEDETPKSSIKPTRLSSKSNQSTYNPVLEDITPVTPEKLMVSGFTEEAFKTPINTPGLFESIRKSVIRSRKRHRESTGSAMKDNKRARVEFAQEEQELENSTDDTASVPQQRIQKSPLNRLSNFEGIKKLMITPAKSPKNDLRNVPNLRRLVSPKTQASPINDLTNVAGVKKMFGTPNQVKSPKNDLTNIPNLRKLVSPRRQNSPRNDLTDVTGVKKIFENSPRNDLTKVPSLRRIMSPKDQNSPKNDLSAPVGVKHLLKTPRAQNEPSNDLGNVSGVANIFNVSGVEVLHQGSDIENSEDLFTKLTGRRPVRSYLRVKSMSPTKEDQQKEPSRKTMGDIPVCSPRVQQWVEEHANVSYAATEDVPAVDDDVFLNVSEKPGRRSKTGRSVSPKKTVKEADNRRKTQGDPLVDNPNVKRWKEELTVQAKIRRSSTANVKSELLSPAPVQSMQQTSFKAKVTPQQQKLKAEQATPLEQATPASVKARRAGRKVAPEDKEINQQKSTTPASIKAKRGRSKVTVTQVDTEMTPADQEMDQQVTPAGEKPKRGRPKTVITKDETRQVSEEMPKEIKNKPLEALKQTGRGKRIMSNEELDVVSSTTDNPDDASSKKTTKNRRRGAKIEIQPSENHVDTADSNFVSEDVQPVLETNKFPKGRMKKTKVDDTQATPEVSESPVRRGGLRGKKVDEDTDKQSSVEEVKKQPVSRGRRGKKLDDKEEQIENVVEQIKIEIKKPAARSRRGKKMAEEQPEPEKIKEIPVQDKPEVKMPAPKSKRGKKVDEEQPETVDVEELVEGREPESKKTAKAKRGKKFEEEPRESIQENVITQSKDIKKSVSRGRRGKKEELQVTESNIEDMIAQNAEPTVQKAVKGRRGKKIDEDTADSLAVEEPTVKPRSKRGNKVEEITVTQTANDNLVIEEPGVKTSRSRKGKKVEEHHDTEELEVQVPTKAAAKGKKGQKVEVLDKQEQEGKSKVRGRQNIEEETDNTDTEVEFKKPTRGRARKGEPQASSASPSVKAIRGRRGAKVIEKETVQSEVVEEKTAPAKRGRGKKLTVDKSDNEHENTEEKEEVELPKKATRGKEKNVKVGEPEKPTKTSTRGKGKVVAEKESEDQFSEKQSTKKPKNKVVEQVKEMDVDSPRTARAKRGVNKKYSTDEYEVTDKKADNKRKVHFEDDEMKETRTSKRTKK